MKLILVRHGEAIKTEVYTDRPLSEFGRAECEKTAKFLKAGKIAVGCIWHSDKKRAVETAEIFNDILKPKDGIVQKPGLLPDDPVEPMFEQILTHDDDVMIVGHIPFLQKLASLALLNSGAFEVIKFNTGGVVCLEKGDNNKWLLVFELMPEIVNP